MGMEAMIICHICNREFNSIISPSHLKSHAMTPQAYKDLYGDKSLATDDYRLQKSKKFSEKNKGKVPWNKGKTIEVSDKQKDAYALREQKYESGELTRREYNSLSEEVKEKISKSIIDYANNNPEDMKQRFVKAQITKTEKGIPLMPSTLGYKHSEKNKAIFRENLLKRLQIKIEKSHINILEKINRNFRLINDISNKSLDLQCKTCNTLFSFTKQYFHDCKFHEKLCPTCFPRNILTSKAQTELYEYIKNIFPDTVLNYKTKHGDIDIFIPSLNLGIEYNGLYWHSVEVLTYNNKSKIKDYEKYVKLKDDGIRLICIMEDEWLSNKEIVLSRLNNIFKITNEKIFARKCDIRLVETSVAREFIDNNHIQGYANSNIKYGLYFGGKLVSIMTLSKNNISRKNSEWEINRFCSSVNTNVVGGANRLFKQFLKDCNPDKVISYADSRWSNGDLYHQLGFEFSRQTVPNYWYFKPNDLVRIHRFTLRKQSNEPVDRTEKDLRFEQGYYHIYDYGSSKWVWNKY